MFKATGTAAVMVLLALAAPAFGDLYTFEIDENQSLVELTLTGGAVQTAMEGTFALDLAGGPGNWAGRVEMETVNAESLVQLDLGISVIFAGDLRLLDFDKDENDSGVLSGSPVASGTVNTEVELYTHIQGLDPIKGWEGPFDWTVDVADDNFLGSREPGWTPEAKLFANGEIDAREQNLGMIPFTITLVGAVVPEPATITLLLTVMLVGLPLFMRRRFI